MNLSWIPNSLSLGNLFLGFISILLSSQEKFIYATILILAAGLFDVFDGKLARKINQPNPIGKELDSLADLVTFGLSPGFMFFYMYHTSLNIELGVMVSNVIFGLIAFLFPLFGALRLAKFNVTESRNFFTGVPSTIAGCSLALILVFGEIPILLDILNPPSILPLERLPWWSATLIFVFYAILMKSRFEFPKNPPNFMNFSRNNSFARNMLSAFFLLSLIVFFKFFLILSTLFYTLKPIFTYKRKALPS
ncbi:MAG: CDP-alcohol phosphatidyltransferase family protein [Spirochaetota bacterium]|nr:CDP-alcohol phosphatidyltransferase family protein [Spirochaetota bacterium]